MSTLIVQLPAPPRLSAQAPEGEPPQTDAEWDWVLASDAQQATRQGRAVPAQLPKAASVIAVLPPQALAWHRLTMPKAPPARLRAALAGLLEEQLLEDEAEVHLAPAAGWKAGEPAWVAAVGKPWLLAQLAALEATGATVDRVVPAWAPEGPLAAHVFSPDGGQHHLLAWRDADGPACLPLAGGGARAWLARQPADAVIAWSTSPESAHEAAHLAGDNVAARSPADGLLAAARWEGNLRQFDLAPQHRGSRVLRDAWRRFRGERAWRPVRWGLAALVVVQLAGLNAWAWQQRQALARQKGSMASLLQGSFPSVRAVIDPGVQMQKEVELLRASAGRPGDTDLEPMLQAADAAWPASRGPAESIKFEPGRLTLGSPGWSPAEVEGFRSRLRPFGLDAEAAPGRLVLGRIDPRRAAPTVSSTTPPPAQPAPPAAQAAPQRPPSPAAAQGRAVPPAGGPQTLPPPSQSNEEGGA